MENPSRRKREKIRNLKSHNSELNLHLNFRLLISVIKPSLFIKPLKLCEVIQVINSKPTRKSRFLLKVLENYYSRGRTTLKKADFTSSKKWPNYFDLPTWHREVQLLREGAISVLLLALFSRKRKYQSSFYLKFASALTCFLAPLPLAPTQPHHPVPLPPLVCGMLYLGLQILLSGIVK